MSVTVTSVKNPFEPDTREVNVLKFIEGAQVCKYIEGLKSDDPDISHVVGVNGKIIDDIKNTPVKDGDIISVCADTKASAVAAFITGYGSFAAAAAAGVGAAIGYGAVYLATTFAIGYGISAIASALGPEPQSFTNPQVSDAVTKQVFGWGELKQTDTEGNRIPYVYGTVNLSGQIINRFITIDGNKETLNVLLGVCDHSLDSISSAKLNKQPYTYFKDVTVDTRLGTTTQTAISGFGEIVTQTDNGAKLDKDSAVTMQTSGNAVEKIVIVITAPNGLYYSNNSGGLSSRSAQFDVQYREVGSGTWIDYSSETMTAASNSTQKKVITIDSLTAGQYEIQVTRTNDPVSSFRGNSDIYLTSIQEIVKEEMTYPGLSLIGIKALATDQLNGSMPSISFLASKNTVSVFDEDLATPAWADKRATNPAWIAYDLIVNKAGKSKDKIVWEDFADWADYCDELIDGDYRFEVNTAIYDGNFADQIRKIARMGRATVIRRGTKYGVMVDKEDTTVSHMFTMASIIDKTYNLHYLPKKDRANCIEVEYTDPDRDHTRQVVSVFSDDYVSSTKLSQKARVSFEAEIPQKQAVREGVFRINCNTYLNRVITFDAYAKSFGCIVGDLCYFQHANVNWLTNNCGGRIIAAGNDDGEGNPYIQLDQQVVIEADNTYKVKIQHNDDTFEERTVTQGAGTTDTLTVASTWNTVPVINQEYKPEYLFGKADTFEKIYRLTDIKRVSTLRRTITAIEYIPEIYTENANFEIVEPTWESYKQKAVKVMLHEFLTFSKDGGYASNVNVSWHRSYADTGSNWTVWLEDLTAGDSPVRLADVAENTYVIMQNLVLGSEYKIYISVSGEGPVDTGDNTNTITIQGSLAVPDDVTNFNGVWDSVKRQVVFLWDHVSNLDLSHYEIRQGSDWASATKVLTTSDNWANVFIDEGTSETITYRIKAVDKSDGYSENDVTDAVAIDTSDCPLSTPGGLSVVSNSIIADDGRNIVTMLATWNADAETSDAFHHYEVELEDMGNNKISAFSTSNREFQWELIPNKQYGVKVRAADVSGNSTSWSSTVLHTTTKDSSAPAAPTSLTANGTYTSIILQWSHGAEYDLDHFVVYRHTSNDSASASPVGNVTRSLTSSNATYIDTPPDTSTYYYWIKAVDTSSNQSDFSGVASDSAPGAAVGDNSITTTMIQDDAITTPKINAGAVGTDELYALAVTAAKIAAGAVTTDKIEALAVTAAKIAAGTITADKLNVTTLSAIVANLGTITAGLAQSPAGNFVTDYSNTVQKVYGDYIWIVEDENDTLDWIENSTTYSATLTAGTTYTPAALAAHVQTQMRAQGDSNTTVTYSTSTKKITIANSTLTTFELLWESGTNAETTCGEALGFDISEDDDSALTYTADDEAALMVTIGALS